MLHWIFSLIIAIISLAHSVQAAPSAVPESVVAMAPAPCAFAQPIAIANPELQDATTRAVGRLTDALGCVPFTPGQGGVTIQFSLGFFMNDDSSGFDWNWVPAAASWPGQSKIVRVNLRCWERVTGDWSLVIAHELGHELGWNDLDGHPYMTCPLVEGEYYRDDLAVVCGP